MLRDSAAMNFTASTAPRPSQLIVRILAAACLALGALVLLTAPASAKPKLAGKFDVSGVGTNNEITKGPDGNIWVTLDQTNDVARIRPNGNVKEFDAANISSPIGIASGPGKTLWVTQAGGVAVFDPADPEAAVKFTINDIADPRPIVRGPDGAMWTVSNDKVIRIPVADPESAESFPLLVAGRDIDRGKDGRLWVADFGGQVVRVNVNGTGKAFNTGNGSGLQAIAAGPKGQAGYADPTSNPQIAGRIVGGKVRKTKAPGDPFGVAFAIKSYWMPRFAKNDLLRLRLNGKASAPVKLGQGAGPRRVTTGPNKTLWVTLDGADQIARVKGVRR